MSVPSHDQPNIKMLLHLVFLLFEVSICHGKALLAQPKTPTGPGFISLPVIAVNNTHDQLQKRQINTDLFNTDFGNVYLVHLSLGTPAQPVYLVLDTGSSETWVNPDCTTAPTPHQQSECLSFPRYDPYASSSALDTKRRFDLAYGSGTASGEYLLETFQIAGATIDGLKFGWADTTTYTFAGILGTGYGVEVADYYCLVDQMYMQGIINSRAFSMDLGNVDSATGSILFGGIDTKKFTGSLEKRPIIPKSSSPDGYLRYWILMTSVGITKPGATVSETYTIASPPNYQQPVFLDSGGTLSQLPANLVQAMLADFTGVVDAGDGYYKIDCIQTTQGGTLDFGFGNTTIKVPYHEFIWVPAPGLCYFGALAVDTSQSGPWVLGDTFLRSCYTVFDQDNDNLLLAQYVDCGTNIVPIGSGVDAVPSVTGDCNPSNTVVSTSSTFPSSTSSSSTVQTTSSIYSSTVSYSSTLEPTSSSDISSSSAQLTTTTSNLSSVSSSATSYSTPSTSSEDFPSSSSVTSSSTSKDSTSSYLQPTSTTSSQVSYEPATTSCSSSIISTSSFSTTPFSNCSSESTSTSSELSSSSSEVPASTISANCTESTSFRTTTSSQQPSTTVYSPTGIKTLGYEHVGCFRNSKPRSLSKIFANDTMSVEMCLSVAKAHNPPYPYVGLEYGRECWAALSSPAAAAPTSGGFACTKTCVGNSAQTCGGAAMFNLYHSATATP